MNLKYSLICILLLNGLFVDFSYGQKSSLIDKANKDFDRFEYIDARKVYQKLVEQGYTSAQVYENLGDSYYWNGDYLNASQWYGKLVDEYPSKVNPEYYYRLAQAFKSAGESAKSQHYMRLYVENAGDEGVFSQSRTGSVDYDVILDTVAINSSQSDFGPSFYGDKIVFASSRPGGTGTAKDPWTGHYFTDLYSSEIDSTGNLTGVENLKGDVNTKYHESSATFTKDGNTMYFTRNNFIGGKVGKGAGKTIGLKVFKATRNGDRWVDIEELPFNDDNYSVAHPSLSPDGKRLYFSSDMPGGMGMSDIWYVDITGDNTYGAPVNLGPKINTEARETFPFIGSSGKLYFSTDGRPGYGGYDVYRADIGSDGQIQDVVNLGKPINSSMDDFGLILDEGKRMGYLSSNRGGDTENVVDNIYRFVENCTMGIKGLVFDSKSKAALANATVGLYDVDNTLLTTVETGEDGLFSFAADCEKEYNLRATKEAYEPYEHYVKTSDKTGVVTVEMPLNPTSPCPDNDLGCRLALEPIYFDFDKAKIRPDAAIELGKILVAMTEYPDLKIHIESHTDSRGPDKYNELLSERRAQSTMKWLIAHGVDKSRLSAKGYGESRLLNKCSNGVKCTEEEHQLNRRSYFYIIKE